MGENESAPAGDPQRKWQTWRLLIIGFAAVVVLVGLVFVVATITNASQPASEEERVNALANSDDECVVCHSRTTPGIGEQYGVSTMAVADVACVDCHEVEADYPGGVEHEGVYILPSPSTAMCERCHTTEVAQYNQSRHGLPAYVAYAGTEPLTGEQLALYQSIDEITAPDRQRNALYELEGPAITRFTCEVRHNVGKPHADESVGQCQKCHLRRQRHVFGGQSVNDSRIDVGFLQATTNERLANARCMCQKVDDLDWIFRRNGGCYFATFIHFGNHRHVGERRDILCNGVA